MKAQEAAEGEPVRRHVAREKAKVAEASGKPVYGLFLANLTVFDNGKRNLSYNKDTMELRRSADLVYIDPPYYSPLSDNEYTRRYHFVEGLSKKWEGLEIQQDTKTKKFKKYLTPFGTKLGAYDAFDKLFSKHRESILMVSYSSNALPTMEEIINLLCKYKSKVEITQVDHRYSFLLEHDEQSPSTVVVYHQPI